MLFLLVSGCCSYISVAVIAQIQGVAVASHGGMFSRFFQAFKLLINLNLGFVCTCGICLYSLISKRLCIRAQQLTKAPNCSVFFFVAKTNYSFKLQLFTVWNVEMLRSFYKLRFKDHGKFDKLQLRLERSFSIKSTRSLKMNEINSSGGKNNKFRSQQNEIVDNGQKFELDGEFSPLSASLSSYFCLPKQGMKYYEILGRGSLFFVNSINPSYPKKFHLIGTAHVTHPWQFLDMFPAEKEWLSFVTEAATKKYMELREIQTGKEKKLHIPASKWRKQAINSGVSSLRPFFWFGCASHFSIYLLIIYFFCWLWSLGNLQPILLVIWYKFRKIKLAKLEIVGTFIAFFGLLVTGEQPFLIFNYWSEIFINLSCHSRHPNHH